AALGAVGAVLAAARRGAEEPGTRPFAERQRALFHDERAAHRIAHHLDTARRVHARARRLAARRFDDVVDDAPERARDDDEQDDEKENPDHYGPGFEFGCADCRLSSARLPACPSGLSGASLIPCCHACDAPSRSCLPNARTIPTFSSVLACLGSSFNECSNCASALSAWFV